MPYGHKTREKRQFVTVGKTIVRAGLASAPINLGFLLYSLLTKDRLAGLISLRVTPTANPDSLTICSGRRGHQLSEGCSHRGRSTAQANDPQRA